MFLVFLRGDGEGSHCGFGEQDHRCIGQCQSLSEPDHHGIQAAYCTGLLLALAPFLSTVVFFLLKQFIMAMT